MREYARNKKIIGIIRNVNDIMMSTTSIIIATFTYAVVVAPMGHFSGWAGIIALSIIIFPIILKTTDDMCYLWCQIHFVKHLPRLVPQNTKL